MKRLINQMRQPLPLESGIVLAAADTEGSARIVEDGAAEAADVLCYVKRGLLLVTDAPVQPAAPASAEVDVTNTRSTGGKGVK